MAKRQINLTLTRRGSFRIVSVKNDTTQCGLRGTRKLFYRVEVTCPSVELDKNGFMVDQLDIHKMITERYAKMNKMPSCELLAIDCSQQVWKMVKKPIKVCVSMGMSARAFMTAELT
jgi:hypothetical protein